MLRRKNAGFSMRGTMFTYLVLFSAVAMADVHFESFLWKADNGTEIRFVHNGASKLVKGELPDKATVEVSGEAVTISQISFSNSFVGLAFVESGREMGEVVILERQNARYVPITGMIKGRASSLVNDLKGSVEGLNKVNRWDASLALRALASYFDSEPRKTLTDFYDDVERHQIRTLAKPRTKNSKVGEGPRAPSEQHAKGSPDGRPRDTEVSDEAGGEPAEPRTRTRKQRRRERLPEGFIPPRDRSARSQYPGQYIPRRNYEPPPRRPRGLMDFLFGG